MSQSTTTKRAWVNPGNLAWLGMGSVLVFLSAFSLGIALSSSGAGDAVRRASTLGDAYGDAAVAVTQEESLERKYRLEPGPDVLARYHAANAALLTALEDAKTAGDATDADFVAHILALHQSYLLAIGRMFAAVDANQTALVLQIDSNEVDPSFAEIESLVTAADEKHQVIADTELQNLGQTDTVILVATPVMFLLGTVLVLFFRTAFRRMARRVQESATRELAVARISEQRFRSLVQNAADTVVVADRTSLFTYMNPGRGSDWEFGGSGHAATTLQSIVHPGDAAAADTFFAECLELPGGIITTELRVRVIDGTWRQAEVIGTNLLGKEAVDGVVLTIRDITERRAFEDQLKTMAFRDPMTKLANRALFIDRLDHALAGAGGRGQSVGVLFLDLDNFKLVNDSLGHGSGDRLLVAVAERLKAAIRAGDTAARFGGDEFTILLGNVESEAAAMEAVSRIEAGLKAPFTIDGRELFVTASIGVALSMGRSSEPETLVRNADLAMYRAKLNGKARHETFDGSMDAGALARIELETDLRHALDRHEFRVYYQPIVALDDSRVTGVEALVRWMHPVRGLVQPNDFIPVAEDTGLIVPIGRWVLEEACRQAASWNRNRAGPPLTMSVNLSARQFQHPGLLEDIVGALREADLDPGTLTLEITEGVVMKDPTAAALKLHEMKDLGVRIAVDDFGTGYSSLAYLKDFPVDSLKIDRSFTSGVGGEGDDAAIVRSIVALGHALRLSVTAEGIETRDQLVELRTLECDRGQGFLFARPVPADELTALLMDRKVEGLQPPLVA